MTQPKSYNRKIFCDLVNIEEDSEDADDFMKLSFNEQLRIIKQIREDPSSISIKQAQQKTLLDRILFKK